MALIRFGGKELGLDDEAKEYFGDIAWERAGWIMRMTQDLGLPRDDKGAEQAARFLASFRTFVRAGLIFETPEVLEAA